MATHRVGGEVDAACTRCKLELAHTILAMVGPRIIRVRCNTCGGDHVYRGVQGTTSTRASSAAKGRSATPAEKAQKTVLGFDAQLAGAGPARDYSPRETFQVDQVVRHPTFGLGIVRAVRQDKVDIAFKAAEKTLVHGRAAPPDPAARPAWHPPARSDETLE